MKGCFKMQIIPYIRLSKMKKVNIPFLNLFHNSEYKTFIWIISKEKNQEIMQIFSKEK